MSKFDPEIAAALEGYVEEGEDDIELEDDFVQLAGGEKSEEEDEGEDWWKSTGLDEKAGREEMMRRFGLVRERHSSASEDDENCEEDEKEENHESRIGRKTDGKEDAVSLATTKDDQKSRFTNYSMSSAVIKRPDGLRQIDDHFEQLYAAQYAEEMEGEGGENENDDDNEEEKEENESTGLVDPNNSKRFQELLEDDEAIQQRFHREIPDAELKEAVLRYAEAKETGEGREETERILVPADDAKRGRWDCESIVSTYSTLYNHPTVIRDEFSSARRKQRNSGLTKRGLKNLEEKMDLDMAESVKSSRVSTASTFRPKGETPEERKQRKQAIKEERRERRQDKKANRMAFHEAKLALDGQEKRNNKRQKIRQIH